jgi:glucose-1-phosphate thymidylyltransferase
MKGLILSGGFGTRLRPLTYSQQKQLIPVANKPILFYAIIALGIKDIGIIVGPNKEQVKKAIEGRSWDANIEFIPQDLPRGLAHTVMISEKFIGNDSFVMYLGDNLLRDSLEEHARSFISSNAQASILLTKVDHPERFGVAKLDERGEVVRLVEKPKIPPSDLALVGIYFFQPIIFEAVKEIKPSWRNELEITDAIQWLVDKGFKVKASITKGWWKDTGRPEDILSANHLILYDIEPECLGKVLDNSLIQGKVRIGENTILEKGSVVRGPVIIGSNCRISNSYIGPYTSIGDGCELKDAEIEGSIVMDGSKIDVRRKIVDSLIGASVSISESNQKPNGYRFVLGDSSEVKV